MTISKLKNCIHQLIKCSHLYIISVPVTLIILSGSCDTNDKKQTKITDSDVTMDSIGFVDNRAYYDTDELKAKHVLKIIAHNGMSTPLEPQSKNSYEASNLTDNNLKTGWATKLTDYGLVDYISGPTIELNAKRVDMIEIVNGYAKDKNSFANNTRAGWIMIYRPIPPDTGMPEMEDIAYVGPLKDTMKPQKLKVNSTYDNSRPTNTLIIQFSSNYDEYFHGQKWDDLVISELKIYGE